MTEGRSSGDQQINGGAGGFGQVVATKTKHVASPKGWRGTVAALGTPTRSINQPSTHPNSTKPITRSIFSNQPDEMVVPRITSVRGSSQRLARRKATIAIASDSKPAAMHTISRPKRKVMMATTKNSPSSRRHTNSSGGGDGGTAAQPRASTSASASTSKSSKAADAAKSAPYVCQTCGRRYQVLGTLTRHMRKECNQPKKYVCRMCGRGFHYNFKLQDHYYYVHKGHPQAGLNKNEK